MKSIKLKAIEIKYRSITLSILGKPLAINEIKVKLIAAEWNYSFLAWIIWDTTKMISTK